MARLAVQGTNETALSFSDLVTLTWDELDRDTMIFTIMGGRNKSKVKQQVFIRSNEQHALFAELEAAFKKLPNIGNLVFTREEQPIAYMALRRASTGVQGGGQRHCALTR